MNYEARHHRGINFALAAAVLLLSLLGLVLKGMIPTESTRYGVTYPFIGWGIVIACVGAALEFVRRALDDTVQASVDEEGIYSKQLGTKVPWADISGFHALRPGPFQRLARFDRREAESFAINTTFYDRGMADLWDALRTHRPELAATL